MTERVMGIFPLGSGVLPVGVFASVEVDVLGRNVGGINRVVGASEVEVDGDREFLFVGDGAKFVEVGLGDEAAFTGWFSVVGNVDEFLADAGAGIADGVDDASPVRVASVPGGFDEG